MANALYDQAGFVLLSDVHRSSTFGPWKRALAKVDKEETFHLRHGRTWVKKLCADPAEKPRVQAAADWMFILTLEWFGLPDERKRHGIQLEYGFKGMSNDELRQAWMARGRAVHGRGRHRRPRALGRGRRSGGSIDCPFPARFDEEPKRVAARRRADRLGRGDGALEGPRADEPRLRRPAAERATGERLAVSRMTALGTPAQEVEARLWRALRDVEDPEIPISVVGMGLIVSIAYRADERAVDLELTFTAMGCPAMDFIEDDIRERLLREPEVDEVRIEVVWDPVWTRSRIREDARATMRELGIVA